MKRKITQPKVTNKGGVVSWTCPICNHKNSQFWQGNQYQACAVCDGEVLVPAESKTKTGGK